MCTYHVLHRLSSIYIIYVFLHNFPFLCFLCVCEIMQKSVLYHQKYRENLSLYSYFTQSALLFLKPLEKPLEKSFHMHQTSMPEEKPRRSRQLSERNQNLVHSRIHLGFFEGPLMDNVGMVMLLNCF